MSVFELNFLNATGGGAITLPDGVEQVLPGDEASMMIELLVPAALEVGTMFEVTENDRFVAIGFVTETLVM